MSELLSGDPSRLPAQKKGYKPAWRGLGPPGGQLNWFKITASLEYTFHAALRRLCCRRNFRVNRSWRREVVVVVVHQHRRTTPLASIDEHNLNLGLEAAPPVARYL